MNEYPNWPEVCVKELPNFGRFSLTTSVKGQLLWRVALSRDKIEDKKRQLERDAQIVLTKHSEC